MPLTPSERSLRAQAAVHASWAHTADRRARTKPASEAFAKRFENQVDPDRVLPEAERARRAENARRAYFAALSLKASKARRKRAQRADAAIADDVEHDVA
jgi:hypothetical protein